MLFRISLSAFTLFSLSLSAEPLTLQKAFEEAEFSNPQLRKTEAVSNEANWRRLEALSPNLPRGSIGASHNFNEKYQLLDVNLNGNPLSIAQVYPKTAMSLDLQWTLFDGLQTPSAYLASTLSADAAELDLERARANLHAEIRNKFFQALAAKELAEVAKENVKALEDHLQKANSRRKAGEITKFDSLRVQVQLEEARPELKAAEDNVFLSRELLLQALGKVSDDRELEGKLPSPEHAELVQSLSLERSQRQDVKAAQKRFEASEKMHLSSLGNWAPRVSLNADKTFYNNIDRTMTDSEKFRDAYSIGLNLTWNLFDANNLARNKIAAAQAEAAKEQSIALNLKAPYEFDYWKRKYAYSAELYQARRRALEAAEESLRLANAGWNAGSRTSSDILDAELDLFRARAGIIRAELDAIEAISNLELAIGRNLL